MEEKTSIQTLAAEAAKLLALDEDRQRLLRELLLNFYNEGLNVGFQRQSNPFARFWPTPSSTKLVCRKCKGTVDLVATTADGRGLYWCAQCRVTRIDPILALQNGTNSPSNGGVRVGEGADS